MNLRLEGIEFFIFFQSKQLSWLFFVYIDFHNFLIKPRGEYKIVKRDFKTVKHCQSYLIKFLSKFSLEMKLQNSEIEDMTCKQINGGYY